VVVGPNQMNVVVVPPPLEHLLFYHGGYGTTSIRAGCFAKGSCGTSSTEVTYSSTSIVSATNSMKACCSTRHRC
jgi:hypothetical protein